MTVQNNILIPVADFLAKKLKDELLNQGHKATGELIQSIEVAVQSVTDGFRFVGNSIYYGEFVERGRKKNLKGVPITALLNWISVRKINLHGASEKSVAFAMQASIKKKGIKPGNFVRNTLEKNEIKISNEVEKYMHTYLLQLIEEMITNNLKKWP